jgi:uncharacterized protein YegJ (DUF2314 family)
MMPCTEKARATYPDAKRRYLAGLPAKYVFYVTVRLSEPPNLTEQTFVRVERITEGTIVGRIENQIVVLHGYKNGDSVTVPEAELLDWMISRPDGTEEGNLRGKFVDAIGAGRRAQC